MAVGLVAVAYANSESYAADAPAAWAVAGAMVAAVIGLSVSLLALAWAAKEIWRKGRGVLTLAMNALVAVTCVAMAAAVLLGWTGFLTVILIVLPGAVSLLFAVGPDHRNERFPVATMSSQGGIHGN